MDNTKNSSVEKKPVVFMFQPKRFETVTPDKYKEWEQLLEDKVGLSNMAFKSTSSTARVPSISFCGDIGSDACDCDQV
jgi:hypothetical protein